MYATRSCQRVSTRSYTNKCDLKLFHETPASPSHLSCLRLLHDYGLSFCFMSLWWQLLRLRQRLALRRLLSRKSMRSRVLSRSAGAFIIRCPTVRPVRRSAVQRRPILHMHLCEPEQRYLSGMLYDQSMCGGLLSKWELSWSIFEQQSTRGSAILEPERDLGCYGVGIRWQ